MSIFSFINVNRTVRILLGFLFFAVMAEAFYVPLFAVFVTDFIEGATLRTAGFAFAIYSIAKSAVQLVVARRLDQKQGERDDFLALCIGAVAATCYPFLLLFISQPWHLYVLEGLLGVGTAFLMAAYYAIFARHVDKGAEGFEWSLYSVGGLTLSYAVGAALGGYIGDVYGFRTLFLISGIITATALVFLFFLYPVIARIKSEKVAVPRAPHSFRIR